MPVSRALIDQLLEFESALITEATDEIRSRSC